MNEPPGTSPIDALRHRLAHLHEVGRRLRPALAESPDDRAQLAALGVWQRECAATISQLSGGRKVHWLSRAFSEALLVPLSGAESASPATIIDRILEVLDRATVSLTHATEQTSGGPDAHPPKARFTFIVDEALRSGLEQAYLEGQAAFSRGEFASALVTFSSILEAVLTDALDRRGLDQLSLHDPPPGPIVQWPFASRIAIAERARLISSGCARLPDVARRYHDLLDSRGEIDATTEVSSREAKLTRDVLHVIVRDLAPSR